MAEQSRWQWSVGVDEAGYGPNLGPLMVAATAWRGPADADLRGALEGVVTDTALVDDGRLLVADSKLAYKPGAGLAPLEQAVYAALDPVDSWSELCRRLGAAAVLPGPWTDAFDPPLPINADADRVAQHRQRLTQALAAAGFDRPVVAARLVTPAEFNRLVGEHGTKGAALSHVSIGLARRVFEHAADPGAEWRFTFDKHGGRNRYGALLQEHFPESWVEVCEESRPLSRYRAADRVGFAFRTKGEAELPVALASMTAKLLREIEMLAFNAFWRRRLPDLRPTAGYPVDAKRFRADIAAVQAELGIADTLLWRER